VRPHTTVDHRDGGDDVDLSASSAWIALAIFASKSDRQPAVISEVETMIEQFGRERHVHSAFVMASRDGHRVVAFLWLANHAVFHALQSAWDQHHRHLAREDKAESMQLLLCRSTLATGEPIFEVGGSDVVTFEQGKPGSLSLPLGDDPVVLGSVLLEDDAAEHSFLLVRRSRVVDGQPRYHIVKSWDAPS
jgi:hypothetical protein